jgi:hypothetical protein
VQTVGFEPASVGTAGPRQFSGKIRFDYWFSSLAPSLLNTSIRHRFTDCLTDF